MARVFERHQRILFWNVFLFLKAAGKESFDFYSALLESVSNIYNVSGVCLSPFMVLQGDVLVNLSSV